ncbi:MAG: polysaccharide deacetylase family protein [Bacteroidales bacterium]|nr:polysaccharide deacetylase family protein [Bacteroidales bacterium]
MTKYIKTNTSGSLIILLLMIMVSYSSFSQKSIEDQDSLFRLKESQLKGYTNINILVAEQGYKNRYMDVPDDKLAVFPGLEGPMKPTILPAKSVTSWKKYSAGTSSRLAIFLTDTASNWLGIVSGLKAQGVPFRVTTSIDDALTHTVVLIYPAIDSKNMDIETFVKLREHPKNGGVLIGFNVIAPSMQSVFGFGKARYSNQRDNIIIRNFSIPETSFIEDINEAKLRIGNLNITKENTTTFGYEETAYQPIGVFEDGSAAIIRNLYNDGACYAFGFDLGFLTIFAHANLDPQIQRTYVNDFEPTLDVLYRMIKSIYIEYSDFPILPGMVPENKKVAILISHDIDYTKSIDSMLLYAEMERSKNVKATYFVQTRYIKDGLDQAYLKDKYIPYFIALKNMGMEIASHSVSHTPFLSHIPLGTGLEKYPDYRPYYFTFTSTFNETILGELRVSHFLIKELFGVNATSFRSGYLRYPEKLHVSMQEVGFKYGSSITANEVLTHMPFNPMYDYMFDEELDVFEIPVTIEDELPPKMDKRVDDAIILTEKISRYGGVVNILIHTNILGHKYRFQEQYTDHYKDEAWFGTISQYGDWWQARTAIQIDIQKYKKLIKVNIEAPLEINHFPIIVPKNLKLITTIPLNNNIERTEEGYLFSKLNGRIQLIFEDQSALLSR